jgi:hypothetical protein
MFFLYSPEGHFANAMTIYSAMKRLLNEKYYKSKGKRKNKNDDEDEKKAYKGTIFEKC